MAEAYKSWRSRGKPGESPQGDYGHGNYIQLRADDLDIVENDQGWGLKVSFVSYNPVWFHIDDGAFQREFLERITDEDDPASAGSGELHLHDDGTLFCHLTVSWPVETYRADEISTTVGVDLNADPLVAAAVVDDGEVQAVEFESGSEYRHHRERLKKKRSEAMATGDLRAIKSNRLTYQRYTEHITDVASRRVVDLAVEHSPAQINLEELTYYRETAKDPIHDWPFAKSRRKSSQKPRKRASRSYWLIRETPVRPAGNAARLLSISVTTENSSVGPVSTRFTPTSTPRSISPNGRSKDDRP